MITAEGVLLNLEGLIRKKNNFDDVKYCFEDFEENGETRLILGESVTRNICDYMVNIDTEKHTSFYFILNNEDELERVFMSEP